MKTPVRPSISWMDGAKDFLEDYWRKVPAFFVPNLFCFASEGKILRYAPIGAPYPVWAPWQAPRLQPILVSTGITSTRKDRAGPAFAPSASAGFRSVPFVGWARNSKATNAIGQRDE